MVHVEGQGGGGTVWYTLRGGRGVVHFEGREVGVVHVEGREGGVVSFGTR